MTEKQCILMERLCSKKNNFAVVEKLENGSSHLKNCQRLPDAIIKLFEAYTSKEIPEERLFNVIRHLRGNGVLTPELGDRIISLEKFSELKNDLPSKVIDEMKRKY